MRVEDLPKDQHRPYEDVMAMLLGTFFVALGVTFLHPCGAADRQYGRLGAAAQLYDQQCDRLGLWGVLFLPLTCRFTTWQLSAWAGVLPCAPSPLSVWSRYFRN